MLTLNHQQQQSRREFASTTPTLKNKQSTAGSSPSFDTTAVTEKVNEWFGSFSSWSSSVKNSLESTITSLTTDDSHSDEGASSSKQQFEAKTTQKNTIVAESSSLSSTNKNNLSKKLQPTTQTSLSNNNQIVATTTNTTQTNMLKDKRSMRQDFGEDDEESLIGTLKKGSLLKPSTNNGSSWLDSFQNIKSQIFSEKTEEDDGPLAKSLSSKTNSKTSSPVTPQNNLLDSLSSTFTSLKTQTGDKWAVLSSQFFETQPPIDENDNSFLGRLTKEFDGMVTLTAKQRMYGFFMALGFGLLCILIALGFLPSILFASGAFAFFYTFGNLLCLISTLFLVGPASQLKNMSKPERAIPSALFVGSMFLTLLCVFFMPLAIFIIILVIVQTISLAWYVVSYIPFAQSILGMVFSSFMKLFN